MFFKLAFRNGRKSRKENGLFFSTLLITVIAFYIILSLPNQDVMIFLQQMESDAVKRLISMLPLFFGAALVILFFLVYYAGKYQMQRRRHEFGLYLMMGMRRRTLFLLLLAEDLYSSIFPLIIGLPVAVLLSELISLVTARIAGMGVIGHRFSFSPEAALLTAAGFLLIKLAAFLILSGRVARQEIGSLLVEMPEGVKRQLPGPVYGAAAAAGLICLGAAWWMASTGISWLNLGRMGVTLLLGLCGTWLLFFGLRFVMNIFAKRGDKGGRLQVFHFRQLEETVIRCYGTLAVSSLLILASLCCFGAGAAIMRFYGDSEPHVLDYTFDGDMQDISEVEKKLSAQRLDTAFFSLFEMRVGYIRTTEDYDNAFRMDSVLEAISGMADSEEKQQLENILMYADYPHIISLSGYNQLLEAAGLPQISLEKGEAGVYMDGTFAREEERKIMDELLASEPAADLDGTMYRLAGNVQSVNLVTDDSITLSFALILPDEDFEYYTQGEYTVYLDGVLKKGEGESLMSAIMDMNSRLDQNGIIYESYLQNMGRQMFYIAAAGYITIYLAVVFLIIANTVIGVQFLMSQRRTGRRYQTLSRLGASYRELCRAAGRQVNWYFGIPAFVAAVSSMFGVRALLMGILSSRTRSAIGEVMWISVLMILFLCVIECIYMAVVKRSCNRYLLAVMEPEREE